MSARRRPRGSMQAAAGRAAPAPPGQETTGAREPRRPVVRIAPVKATFELDPVLLRRVKIWAGRRVLHVAPVVRALLAELVGDELRHLWRQAGEAIAAGLPEALPDGARRSGPVYPPFRTVTATPSSSTSVKKAAA